MKRRDEVLVGLLTTVAVAVAAVSSVWLVRGGLEKGYPLYVRFPWGAGLKQGQPVWLAGVNVGFVDRVELDPRGTLLVTLRVQRRYRVPVGSSVSIVPNGFFGDMAVALNPIEPTDVSYSPGDTLPLGSPYGGLQAITARADTLARSLGTILDAFRSELVDSGGLRQLRGAAGAANRALQEIGTLAASATDELRRTSASLRSRLAAIDSAQVDSTLRSLRGFAAALETLGSDLQSTTRRLDALVARTERGEGNLGRLLADTSLYQDVHRLLLRVDSLVLEFKTNPRKFIRFSVF
ncbi:MAG TPA: MlaD family protein [Gemmatimonadaceae bacterium]|jgi:phospholipid/cholesterol/gamma-HCH transport system substrate-binding protein|nr:MlaD family protein [Gemmatimonadaceae bacterium]